MCTAFFSSKIELRRSPRFSTRTRSLSEACLGSRPRRDEDRWPREGKVEGRGVDSKNGVADPRRAVTPGPISRGHFSPEGERRRQPKITPLGPPSRAAADQSPGHGLIESRQSLLVGLIAPHHFRTSERSTSLLRDFYPDALARPRRAASRIKLEGVSSPH